MWESAVVYFREGLEAFLILAIMFAYLTQIGQRSQTRFIWLGVAISIVISILLAFAVRSWQIEGDIAEGVMSLIGGILVLTLTWQMHKAGKHMKKHLTDGIDNALQKSTYKGLWLLLFTVFIVAREGFEVVLFTYTIALNNPVTSILIGAAIGLIGVAIVAALWVKYSGKIKLPLLFKITHYLLLAFGIYLIYYGLHELGEAGIVPFEI